MLKTDLHLHTKSDPIDRGCIFHDEKQLIDHAKKEGFEVIAITNHEQVIYNEELAKYAAKKGILLIKGGEASIEGCHVLVYNVSQEELAALYDFHDLKDLREKKGKDILVIAPHPYYPLPISLNKKFERNIALFDAVEISHFYLKNFDFNKKARKKAEEYKIPLVGNSDAHLLRQIGTTYSLVDSKKYMRDIFENIRTGKLEVKSKPLKLRNFSTILAYTMCTIALGLAHESGKKRGYVE